MIRALGPEDRASLERFLLARRDSSMFLLAALDQPIFTGVFRGERLAGVAAHFAHGPLAVQCGEEGLVDDLVRAARRGPVSVISGPYAQVVAARRALGLTARLELRDRLYTLELARLRHAGGLDVSTPREDELATVAGFRSGYLRELMGVEVAAETLIDGVRSAFVLREGGRPVAMSLFNARLPDAVQIGGVYTPPALRGRGHGRGVVAGSLLAARDLGVSRAVLFTSDDNLPAQKAYEALGFVTTGEAFGLCFVS